MKKALATLALGIFMVPSVTFASGGITHSQAEALILVLVAFGVDQPVIDNIRTILEPVAIVGGTTVTSITQGTPDQNWHIQVAPIPTYVPPPVVDTPPVQQQPVVVLPPVDSTPPILNNLFSIDWINKRLPPPTDVGADAGYYLRLISNEPLDLSATILPQGMSLSDTPTYSGLSSAHDFVRFPGSSELKRYYYYEVMTDTNGVKGPAEVTVKDMAGNGVTRTLIIQ